MFAKYLPEQPQPNDLLVVVLPEAGFNAGEIVPCLEVYTSEKHTSDESPSRIKLQGTNHKAWVDADNLAFPRSMHRLDEQTKTAEMFRHVVRAGDTAPAGDEILTECLAIASLLVHKNADYGDSALNPVRIFSTADPVEQIKVRIDDKLSRLQSHSNKHFDEDTVSDLIGYLVLLKMALRRAEGNGE